MFTQVVCIGIMSTAGLAASFGAIDTVDGSPVYFYDEGPFANADDFAGVCGLVRTNGSTLVIIGTGVYLGNGQILTAKHVTEDLFAPGYAPVLALFPRNQNGVYTNPQAPGGFSNFRAVEVLSTQPAPGADVAILTADITIDDLSDIPVARVSTAQLPTDGVLEATHEERALGLTPTDQDSNVMHPGWGKGTYGWPSRRLRYGLAGFGQGDQGGSWNWIQGVQGDDNDSGSPIFVTNQAGDLVLVGIDANVVSGPHLRIVRRDPGFDVRASTGLIAGPDVTGESGSGGAYVTGLLQSDPFLSDGGVDAHDAVMARARISAGDLRFDFDQSGSLSESDWITYLGLLADSEPNLYMHRNYLPLPADTLDLNGDGRLNEADSDWLSNEISTGSPGLELDFTRDGQVTSADLSVFAAVVTSVGHGLFGDLNADGVVNDDDLTSYLLYSASFGDAFYGNVSGVDSSYRLALDSDVDGDNDLSDAFAYRRLRFPLDQGHADSVASARFVYGEYTPEFVVNEFDRITAILANSVVTSNADNDRVLSLFDNSSASDPSAPGYGVPDGRIGYEDLWWYLLEYELAENADVRFPAVLDPNNDHRFNSGDLRWYIDHEGSLDPGHLVWDITGDGALDSLDSFRVTELLYRPWSGHAMFCDSTTTHVQSYNHGYAGDFSPDPVITDICMLQSQAVDANGDPFCIIQLFCTPDMSLIPVPTVDCADRLAMENAIIAGDFAFDGRKFGDPGFMFSMDIDLDGDNDQYDYARVNQLIEPADANGNGQLESTDFTAWIAAFNSGSPMADANLDGQVTPTDYTAWFDAWNNPNCP